MSIVVDASGRVVVRANVVEAVLHRSFHLALEIPFQSGLVAQCFLEAYNSVAPASGK